MKKLMSWFAAAALLITAQGAIAADYQPGVDYKVLDKPVRTLDPSKVEVVEMFGYWCPHCNDLEEYIEPWRKALPEGAYFNPIPVVFRKNQTELAKSFYVAKTLGILDKTHEATFDLLHNRGGEITNRDEMLDFFKTFGVSETDFNQAYNEFSLSTQLAKARKKGQQYQISGVPTLIVNGKYVISIETAHTQPNMIKIADYLMKQELAAMGQ